MKQICAFFAVLLISFLSLPVSAAEQGSTSFVFKIPATRDYKRYYSHSAKPKECEFGDLVNKFELQNPYLDKRSKSTGYLNHIEWMGFTFKMTIPSSITNVVLGVAYSQDGVHFKGTRGLEKQRFSATDGSSVFDVGWAYVEYTPRWWNRYLDFRIYEGKVQMFKKWETDVPTKVSLPRINIQYTKTGAPIPDPDRSKTWHSDPIYLTCYAD